MRLPASPLTPIALALAVTVAGHLAVQVAAVGFPASEKYQAPDPVPSMASVGGDLQISLRAGQVLRAGAASYDAIRLEAKSKDRWGRIYPYPPVVVWMLAPLSFLSDLNALRVWGLLFLLLWPASLLLYLRWAHPTLEGKGAAAVGTLMIFALSASALLELERGNFDWTVAALSLVGLALLARGRDLPAGAAIGLAVAMKVYPVVLLPVLLATRRFKAAASCVVAGLVVFLVTGPSDNLQWLRALTSERTGWLEVRAWNTTLANALGWAFPSINASLADRVGLGAWALLMAALLAALVLARRAGRFLEPAHAGALAFPLMFMVPATSWSYTLFTLLPALFVLAHLWREAPQRRLACASAALLLGLCQTPLAAIPLRASAPALVPVFSLSLVGLSLLAAWVAWRAPALALPEPRPQIQPQSSVPEGPAHGT
ncbi:MAG TPA: glycosyltransferase family 87 protein [Myxococcales bacterium]|jgi:hypothetical protein